MSDQDEAQEHNLANDIGWFVAGAVVGMTLAVLLAPQSGEQTRQIISDKTKQGKDAVTKKGEDVYGRSKEVIDQGRQLVEDAADLFDRGRKLVRGL
jgi:gas vesicle protein